MLLYSELFLLSRFGLTSFWGDPRCEVGAEDFKKLARPSGSSGSRLDIPAALVEFSSPLDPMLSEDDERHILLNG